MSLLFAAMLTGAMAGGVDLKELSVEDRYEVDIETWRQQRVERLKAPGGWLSLVGLHWLKDGANTVGGGKGNDVVIAGAPEKIGTVTVAGKEVTIVLEPRAATINGSDKASRAVMRDDSHERPTTVGYGTTSFYLIDRDGKKALRVKDTEAATRKNFAGIENFETSPKWRIEAKWEAFNPPRTMEVPTVMGTVEKYQVPGKAVFKVDGKEYSVQPVLETADAKELFLIFADKTSGKETYGAARFLYAAMPADGKIVLDFNKAYNPPCAFTPYATCPLAPPENKLALRVTAGEKKYKGAGAH